MGTVAGPRLAREFVQDRSRHGRLAKLALRASLAAAIPLAIAVAAGAPFIMQGLFGGAFVPAAPVLRLLAAGFVVVFPLQVMHAVAISVNAERLLVRAAIVGCVANVLVNFVLIPRWGMIGAAVATVASESLSLGLIALRVRLFASDPPAGTVRAAERTP
jgi:O-antigen/teichoic acid export membrane protein